MKCFRAFILSLVPLTVSACSAVVLQPSGDIAAQQRDILLMSTFLMLLIIVPVMALTAVFAWRYRASNEKARYEPDWDHSTQLELVIWSAPLLIIICLGALTWVGTHLLDPYRPLSRIAPGKAISAHVEPLEVNVVAMDWKWLFIYPEQGIATVNEMAAPTNRPINFTITSSAVMNAFYVPALAGMIYAMPGMETKLHAVMNTDGDYEGFSANYSGSGFSGMRFTFRSLSEDDFSGWVENIRENGGTLDRRRYLELEKPSENDPVRTFGTVEPGLYKAALNMCVEPGKMCMGEMMAIDARGGLGLAGIHNVRPLEYDKYARRGDGAARTPAFGKTFVGRICRYDPEELQGARPSSLKAAGTLRVQGAGLPRPAAFPASGLQSGAAGAVEKQSLLIQK